MHINETYLNIIIAILAGTLISGFIFWYFFDRRVKSIKLSFLEILKEKNEMITKLDTNLAAANLQMNQIKINEARLHEKLEQTFKQIDFLQESKNGLKIEFENLANKIFEEKSTKFSNENIKNINNLILPFRQELKDISQKAELAYQQESKERYSLTKEIEGLKKLNKKMSEDAVNLTNALKGDNKTQGTWGELILEKILEDSGLKEGREYEIQKSLKDHQNKLYRPDVIINLPDSKNIVIDSKASLKSYENYYSLEDERKKSRALNDHINSINTHIKSLSLKNYHKLEGIKTLDFILMFIPIEGAFLLALENDKDLFQRAYAQNIILVSPSTLLATLRTIQNIWRTEYQNKNAQIIAKKAGNLYDKFVNFVNELQSVGEQLSRAQNSYDEAFKKLSTGKGNLLNKVNELKELEGFYSKKELPKE